MVGWVRVAVGGLLVACSFDSGSSGATDTDGSSGDDTAATNTTPGVTNPTQPATSNPTVTTAAPTTDPDTDTMGNTTDPPTSGTDATSDTTSTADCEDMGVIWAEDVPPVDIVDPVELNPSQSLVPFKGSVPEHARGYNAGMGTITFTMEMECDAVYYVYGLLYQLRGDEGGDADSWWYAIDEEATPRSNAWEYGCTSDFEGRGYSWEPLSRWLESECDVDDTQMMFTAADHRLQLLTREDTSFDNGNDLAGVAAIAYSTRPGFDPYDFYDPNNE